MAELETTGVIVITDDCGHTNVYAFTDENMRVLLSLCIEAEKHNTFLDRDDLRQLVDAARIADTLSAKQLADLILPMYSERNLSVGILTIRPKLSNGWW